MASLINLKQYFNFANASEFAAEAKKLTPEDKQELLELLQKEIDAGHWMPPNAVAA